MPPTYIITAESKFGLDLRELWSFRDLFLQLGLRDVKLIYKQTFVGVTWVLAQPLIGAVVFAFVFGIIGGLATPGKPFFPSAFAAMLGWTFFSTILSNSTNSVVGSAHLITKTYFPRIILPLSTIIQPLINLMVGMVFMTVLIAIYGLRLSATVLLLPVTIFFLATLGLGLGLLFSSMMIRYRDVKFVVPLILQVLLYLSPVGYSVASVRIRVSDVAYMAYMANPLASLVEHVRIGLSGSGQFDIWLACYAYVVSTLTFCLGAMAFARNEKDVADHI